MTKAELKKKLLKVKPEAIIQVYSCKAVKDEPLDVWKTSPPAHIDEGWCDLVEGTVIVWPKDKA